MKYLVFFSCLLLFKPVIRAHPSVSIVQDSKGNLFYSDLSNVWMMKPDGNKSIAVASVHSHELYIDKNDRLFGEHLWYNGEKLNTWGHYIWKRNPDGTIVKVKDSTAGFNELYSFVRDHAGSMYWHEAGIPSHFWKIDTAGNKNLLGSASLKHIGRIHLRNDGTLFFIKDADIYYIPPGGSIQLYAKSIGEKTLLNTGSSDANVILSLWGDAKGNIYAATGDVIKKIAKNKLVTTIYKSDGLWKPSGGLIAANGDFWVLEYNIPYKVRTIKVSREMQKQIAKGNSFNVIVMPLLLIVFTLAGVWFLFRKKNQPLAPNSRLPMRTIVLPSFIANS